MSKAAPSIRSLALSLGLSGTTVSCALRGVGRVRPATVRRVRAAAAAAGYKLNPLTGSVLSQLRRGQLDTFKGVLAIVDIAEPERKPHGPFHEKLVAGARKRAVQLGFSIEEFVIESSGLSVARLDSILQSRGVHGIYLLPSWVEHDLSQIAWPKYAAICSALTAAKPALNCVTGAAFRTIAMALERLDAMGYQRPGLALDRERDELTQLRYSGAFMGYVQSRPHLELVPMHIVSELERKAFKAWFREFRPDVVISPFTETLDWMIEAGARIPERHGFVCLNAIYRRRPCAAIDLQPGEVGSRGIDALITQLQRNDRGIPRVPTVTTIPCRWQDGPTVQYRTAPSVGGKTILTRKKR